MAKTWIGMIYYDFLYYNRRRNSSTTTRSPSGQCRGVYEQYGFTHVTHVIADNLASGNQTWAQLKRRTKRVNVVTSNWIMDCVKEGRRNLTLV